MYDVNKDKKMKMFMDINIIKEAIQHSLDKHIDKGILKQMCTPEGRIWLSDTILRGEYRVAPPHIELQPKDNGEFRKVYANNDLDRFVLGVINTVYNKLYGHLIDKNCVSYQKGIGVHNIIERIKKEFLSYGYDTNGYKVDLSKYFDSVSKDVVFEALEELNTGSPLDEVLYEYYSQDIVFDENENLIEHYKSLAQGCAFGCFLANYVLRDIDKTIGDMDVIYCRYSDDILMVGRDADKALETLEEMLSTKGLSLNPKKVEKIDGNHPFTFLGFKIDGQKVTLSDKSLKKFKKEIQKRTKYKRGRTLRSATKEINRYLYTAYIKNPTEFGWAEYFFKIINVEEDIIMMDNYIKDHLKHTVTWKWNHTTNMHKCPQEKLRDNGYVSMHKLWKDYRSNHYIYEQQVRCMM